MLHGTSSVLRVADPREQGGNRMVNRRSVALCAVMTALAGCVTAAAQGTTGVAAATTGGSTSAAPAAHAASSGIGGAGSSLAAALTVVPGQPTTGTTATTPYNVYGGGSCGPEEGQYWLVSLTAGERLTITWESSGDFVTGLDIWPPGTTDYTISSSSRLGWYSIGSGGRQQSSFTAGTTGLYPIVFDDSCGQPGPYRFTATIQPGATGSTIANAAAVAPDQQETGNTDVMAYTAHGPGSCGPQQGQYWRLALNAGDTVTVNWGSAANYVMGFDIWPVGTTDANITSQQRLAWFSIGYGGQQQSRFQAPTSGVYPLVFDDSCGQPGPYTFTVRIVLAPATPRNPCTPTGGSTGHRLLSSLKCTGHLLKLDAECGFAIAGLIWLPLKTLKLIEAARSSTVINSLPRATRPAARFLYHLAHAHYSTHAPKGFRTAAETFATLRRLHSAADLVRALPKLAKAISSADFNQIALDLANIAGLRPCVQAVADGQAG